MAGLRDNDIILSINEIPTHSMSLQLASDFIDSCQSLQLTVFNKLGYIFIYVVKVF
jgi:hypothetical protein